MGILDLDSVFKVPGFGIENPEIFSNVTVNIFKGIQDPPLKNNSQIPVIDFRNRKIIIV